MTARPPDRSPLSETEEVTRLLVKGVFYFTLLTAAFGRQIAFQRIRRLCGRQHARLN